MLTIACVLKTGYWKLSKIKGEYRPEHVARLRDMVAQHLTLPYQFVCLSDIEVPCQRIPLAHDWPGWWSKIELFRPGIFPARVLYVDLDVTIVANFDHMVQHSGFTALRNLSTKKKGRLGSGLLYWTKEHSFLYEQFRLTPHTFMQEYSREGHRWGDQGFLQDHVPVWNEWQERFPHHVRSGKLDPPHPDDRFILAHGSPKPWE